MIDKAGRLLLATAVMVVAVFAGGPPAAAESGFIGMQVQGMSPKVSAALGVKSAKGVLVRDIALQGPAAKAGFLRGDLIVAFNGEEVSTFEYLVKMVRTIKSGQNIPVTVLREGRKKNLILKAGTWIDSWKIKKGSFVNIPERGLTLAALTPKVRERFGIRWGSTGVVITMLDRGKSRNLDLRRGEIIRQVNQREVWLPGQVWDMYIEAKKKKRLSLLLLVEGINGFRFSILKVPPSAAAK
ncbi:MAG TPA: PDZ domain-containing protein [Alphaproteobacteria bacterium]|nr:PDZ domain-containing protein [Alphaproteobacteria bacterium]